MTKEVILANAILVLPRETRRGSVVMRDGMIADIAEGGTVPPGAADLDGDYLAPGMIELHTDNLERHIQPRPGVHWPHDAAILAHDTELAGNGITTVFDAMRVGSIPSDGTYGKYARQLATELWGLRGAGILRISHFLHLRAEVCSETLAEEMAEFGSEDRVGIVSLMDHTPGQRQFRDINKLREYHQCKRGLTEDQFVAHVKNLCALRKEFGEMHEAKAVSEAARYGAVLASHDDTTTDHVMTSANYGAHLAEFPTTVEAAQVCHTYNIAVIMGAPNLVRGESHSGNVAARDLAERELLDILSSDYVPAALIMGAIHLADIWDDLPRGIATVTHTPAKYSGLTDRGRIEIGLWADLMRFKLFGGQPMVRSTWVQGQRVS
ncbi:MAG: alpha-D-ribose 1-methylphosphonate 5-triphosphate diphosphatase [Rhodobacteraceae bacterium]|nr:alpha-D-ribose 1-methylphosphonate 5-triphosphate diphosphatase [Paracoccaceae bacterium]